MSHEDRIKLTGHRRRFVQSLIDSGQYRSPDEAIDAAVELLEREERRRLLEKWFADELTPQEETRLGPDVIQQARAWMDAAIRDGQDAASAGRVVDGTTAIEALRDRIEHEFERRKPA